MRLFRPARLIHLRRATWADRWRLLDWRNDRDTCAAFRQSDPVDIPEHLQWLTATLLDNPAVLLYVAKDAVSGAYVGTCRLNHEPDGWHCSITVAPEHRGQGYAAPMITELMAVARQCDRTLPLIADIKRENAKSRRAFVRAGFVEDAPYVRLSRPSADEISPVHASRLARVWYRLTCCSLEQSL